MSNSSSRSWSGSGRDFCRNASIPAIGGGTAGVDDGHLAGLESMAHVASSMTLVNARVRAGADCLGDTSYTNASRLLSLSVRLMALS